MFNYKKIQTQVWPGGDKPIEGNSLFDGMGGYFGLTRPGKSEFDALQVDDYEILGGIIKDGIRQGKSRQRQVSIQSLCVRLPPCQMDDGFCAFPL